MRLLGAFAVVRIINAVSDEVFVIRIGGAAIHYTSFLLRILEPMVKNRRVEVLHEESGRCEELYDLSVRGFSPSRPPCESHVDLFVSGEPWDSTEVDSDILIDCKLSASLLPSPTQGALIYLPFYSLSFCQRLRETPRDLIRSQTRQHIVSERTKKFCAFVAKNCMPERLRMVALLSEYGVVDSLGRCRPKGAVSPKVQQGVEGFETVDGASYLDRAVEAYRGYRFVLCFENTRASGYVTEKIVNAFLAGSIPIYIGAPDVMAHFDQRSFINCNNESLENCAKIVAGIDSNETAYQEMKAHPCLHNNTLGSGFSWHEDGAQLTSFGGLDFLVRRIEEIFRHRATENNTCDRGLLNFENADTSSFSRLLTSPPEATLWWRESSPSPEMLMVSTLAGCPKLAEVLTADEIENVWTPSCRIISPQRLEAFILCDQTRGHALVSRNVTVVAPARGTTLGRLVTIDARDAQLLHLEGLAQNESAILICKRQTINEPTHTIVPEDILGALRISQQRHDSLKRRTSVSTTLDLPTALISRVDAFWIGDEAARLSWAQLNGEEKDPPKSGLIVGKRELVMFKLLFKPNDLLMSKALIIAAKSSLRSGDAASALACLAEVQRYQAGGKTWHTVVAEALTLLSIPHHAELYQKFSVLLPSDIALEQSQ